MYIQNLVQPIPGTHGLYSVVKNKVISLVHMEKFLQSTLGI